MIRKLATLVVLLLAIHFLAVVAGVGWLFSAGRLDKDKARQIAALLAPATRPSATTKPTDAAEPTSRPLLQFDDILNQTAGRSTAEQVQFLRQTFDGLAAKLDRREREIADMRRQIDAAQAQVTREQASLADRQKQLDDRDALAKKNADDAGFAKSMELYDAMSTKQLKDALAPQDDAAVARCLQSMEPKRVAALLKEFKTQAEQQRVNAWLALLRKGELANAGEPAAP